MSKGQIINSTQTKDTKQYDNFLSFVTFTLIIYILPVFSEITNNLFFKIILGIAVVTIIMNFVTTNRFLSQKIKEFCLKFKIRIFHLYLLYVIAYVLLSIFT